MLENFELEYIGNVFDGYSKLVLDTKYFNKLYRAALDFLEVTLGNPFQRFSQNLCICQ